MKFLGIRVGPSQTRVAIVGIIDARLSLLNSAIESRIVYPADVTLLEDKLMWLYLEMKSLSQSHPEISKVCFKTNEYTGTENKSKRLSAYLEAVTIFYWKEISTPVEIVTYSKIGSRSNEVKNHAELRVGRTEKYWNNQMADAVLAAWHISRS